MKNIFGFQVKETQLDALHYAMHDDLILIAKTGFGKSLLYQAPPLLLGAQRLALIIMPLLALEDDQCTKLNELPNCRPFVLKGKTNNREARERIREGSYTHG